MKTSSCWWGLVICATVLLGGCLRGVDEAAEDRWIFGEDLGAGDMSVGTDTPDLSDTSDLPDMVADPCDAAGVDCSGRGECEDSNGVAVCACEETYAGENCEECAAGYQDNDNDGTCERSCELTSLDCGANGTCEDSSGAVMCACEDGYTGDTCTQCAPDYQDNDGDDVCSPACALGALDCSPNGSCEDSSGKAVCECGEGSEGETCGACTAGYQDNDNDGTCLVDCATSTLDCGSNGQCDASSGEVACVCEEGYAGDNCELCDAGYQDNDNDGTCERDCTNTDLDCGANGQCSDASGAVACECDEGYAGGLCDACDVDYQDNDNDGTCAPACSSATIDCGANGTCNDSSGQAACDCSMGYDGMLCRLCAPGYQDNDGDGTCEETCAEAMPSCITNSHCEDTSGSPECVCDMFYEGANCDQCAATHQDNDNDGTCEETCATAMLSCTMPASCSDLGGTPQCVTVPATCAEAKSFLGAVGDGFHTLHVNNDPTKPWDALCVGMDTSSPREYLPLGKTSEGANRFGAVDVNGLLAETTFWMVRIDPISLKVDVTDFSGAKTVYYQEMSTAEVPFATSESCSRQNADMNLWEAALGEVDLSNTPFEVSDTLVPFGECPVGAATVDGSAVDLSIDGGSASAQECGRIGPSALRARFGESCGGTAIQAPDTTLPEDFVLQLGYVGGAPPASQTPTTCLELKLATPTAMDGDYTLYLDRDASKPWSATCVGMGAPLVSYFPEIVNQDVRESANAPKEYLILANTTGDSNLMKNGKFSPAHPSVSKDTRYTKVRFDPRTADIKITDSTFSSTNDYSNSGPDPIPYARVGSCSANCCGDNAPGRAKLDFRNTPFAIDDTFGSSGFCSRFASAFSSSEQVVDIEGDGQCGGASPSRYVRTEGDGCLNIPARHYSDRDYSLRLKPSP